MPVAELLAAAQGVMGVIQMVGGDARSQRLLSQRTGFQTPDEYFDILQATKNRSQQGFDAFSLNFLTNQTDRAFSSTLGSATKLGADPNQLSALFDQKVQSLMKVGAENHRLNMENFSKYLQAEAMIAENKTAEWQSKENMIKDRQQAAGTEKKEGLQNIFNAANAFISTQASDKTMDLFTELKKLLGGTNLAGGSETPIPTNRVGANPEKLYNTGGNSYYRRPGDMV